MLRVAALKNVDYGLFVDDISPSSIRSSKPSGTKGSKGIDGVTYTGLTPLVYKAEHSLLSGLITSFCWAFVMIAAVMAINFRSVVAGLVTMIPTVWPVALVFGMLGWLGIDIDIGTMMTAGVAMGVSSTTRCTSPLGSAAACGWGWIARRRSASPTRTRPRRCTKARSSSASGWRRSASARSCRPGDSACLMMTLLNFGLLADLVLTPAIMAGPLGQFFSKWWLKPRDLETPATVSVHPAEASAVPAPHGPLAPAPQTIPLPATPHTRRRDTATPPGREAAQ